MLQVFVIASRTTELGCIDCGERRGPEGQRLFIGRAGGAVSSVSKSASSDSDLCGNYLRACSILVAALIGVMRGGNSLETCSSLCFHL